MGMDDVESMFHRHVQAHHKTGTGEIQILPHIAREGDNPQPKALQPYGVVFASFYKEVCSRNGVDLNVVDELARSRLILFPESHNRNRVTRSRQDIGLV